MAMKRCPVCGEKYSDTYRNCPFCEEDALQEEEEFRRPVRRSGRSRQFNLITPTLIVLIIIMAALLIYLLYGDQIFKKDGGEGDSQNNPPVSGTVDPEKPGVSTPPVDKLPDDGGDTSGDGTSGSGDASGNQAGVIPDTPSNSDSTPSTQTPASGEMTYEKAMALPGGSGLSLNKSDFTRSVSEGAYQLKATGGSGALTWISQDPGVASVDASGKVTPISAGTVNIVVTDGSKRAVCIVRVKSGGAAPSTSAPSTQTPSTGSSGGSGGANTLNREDMTISVGETFRLRVSGVTTSLSWSVADSSIATVAGDGTVTGVSKGMTTVTVSWDGQSLKCIVRVK